MKITVKLANQHNVFKDEVGIKHTGLEPFQVEDSEHVKNAIAIRLLEKLPDEGKKHKSSTPPAT